MKTMQGQRGGFVLGLIVGLLLGLAIALGVAMYVAKVPVPLMNKVQPRTPEQDAAEAQKNKGWDPNASLAGKQPPRPQMGASGAGAPGDGDQKATPLAEGQHAPPALPAPMRTEATASAPAPAATKGGGSDQGNGKREKEAAALLGTTPAGDAGKAPMAPAAAADPGYTYWVQVGAYARPEDAEAQRAKLAMEGVQAKLNDREQNGKVVHRVRLGPFDTRDEAEAQRQKIIGAMPEASLVRVERGAKN